MSLFRSYDVRVRSSTDEKTRRSNKKILHVNYIACKLIGVNNIMFFIIFFLNCIEKSQKEARFEATEAHYS